MCATELEVFDNVFESINSTSPRKVVDIVDGNVVPVDEITRLMFSDVVGEDLDSYCFIYDPTAIDPYLSESKATKLRREARQNLSHDNRVFLQTERFAPYYPNSETPLTEKFVELLAMLYFRAHGYIVQQALRSHGGVDDVVAWKSPLSQRLQEHGLIEFGCYAKELGRLRTLGKPAGVNRKVSVGGGHQFIAIEAESCVSNVVKNDGGMNQLIGKDWSESHPNEYPKGAKAEVAANKLYITFPAHFPMCALPTGGFLQRSCLNTRSQNPRAKGRRDVLGDVSMFCQRQW